ncbi:MAG: hypothetical protein KGJ21_09775 [Pseudomonadota bacterium]|nr:hypothetical protein [Pseudomonadota bacterium]
MLINTVHDYRRAIRYGKFAWPGGYPLYFICDDGGALCCDCARKERRNVLSSIARNVRDGWRIVAQDVNYEDNDLFCDHCGEQIESAYGMVSSAD